MRSGLFALMFLAGALPAAAQSALEGPLATPGGPVEAAKPTTAKPTTARHVRARAGKAHRAAARAPRPVPAEAAAPAAPNAAPAGTAAPDDPVSLGMKWQGNNDSAAQTRYNNLDGNAFGSGAEVGMKLHF